jgi:hypothetical protein
MDLLLRLDYIEGNHSWVFVNLSKISPCFASFFVCFSFQNQIFVFNCLEEDHQSTDFCASSYGEYAANCIFVHKKDLVSHSILNKG